MRKVVLAAALAVLVAPAGSQAERTPQQRGEYLTRVMGCNDCHTPVKLKDGMPVPDMSRMLSGHPAGAPDPGGQLGKEDIGLIGPTFTSFKMQFGTVYAANLTPDKKTGLGSWTEQQFIQAMKTGRHMGDKTGRPILPPMPWIDFAWLEDADLSAIFAYLRSIKPIENQVPPPKVPPEAIQKIGASYNEMLKGRPAR